MVIFKTKKLLLAYLKKIRKANPQIGFVPTMGALHKGHISLIEKSVKTNTVTICSIFVNPTQFNNKKDFDHYPITIQKDINLLINAGCTVLFLPSVSEMYPVGAKLKNYNLGVIETVLEGKFRPGHYQGVCQIVDKLLTLVHPNHLYMGQKDYQQCMVIKKLIALENFNTKLHICNTVRESSGLAMSSRNLRLNSKEKIVSTIIYQVLQLMKQQILPGNVTALKNKMIKKLESKNLLVDYVEIADAKNLNLIDYWDGKSKLVALIAASVQDVRLIDNLPLN